MGAGVYESSPRDCMSIKILFLAANPDDMPPLAVDKEMRQVDSKIRQGSGRDGVAVVSHWAVKRDDLSRALLQHQPHIVHISGHGEPDQGILLEDEHGHSRPVSTEGLGEMFRILRDNIRLVVLNACFSLPQARAIGEHIDFVVGMRDEITDDTSITFTESLYGALAFGRSVQTAFDLGVVSLHLDDNPQRDRPALLVRSGASADEVLLGPSSDVQSAPGTDPGLKRPAAVCARATRPTPETSSPLPLGKEAQLANLFQAMFGDASDLRRWVYYRLGETIFRELPGDITGLTELIFQTILYSEAHGRINADLFRALATDRKAHTERIRLVSRAWLGHDSSIPPLPPEPPAAPDLQPTQPIEPCDPPGNRASTSPPPALSHTRLTLDRLWQWKELKDQCAETDDHVSFLAHGDAGQDVYLFVERTQIHLSQECKRVHRICTVLFREEHSTPQSPGQWEQRFRKATGYAYLGIEQALQQATRYEPVMFIVGNRTLRGLDDVETQALADTLAEHLPRWLRDARPAHPVRVLIPVEHARHSDDGSDDPLTSAITDALYRARSAGLRFAPLIPLTMPTWIEVRDYLQKTLDRPGAEFLRQCREAYAHVTGDPDIHQRSYDRLARALNQLIADQARN